MMLDVNLLQPSGGSPVGIVLLKQNDLVILNKKVRQILFSLGVHLYFNKMSVLLVRLNCEDQLNCVIMTYFQTFRVVVPRQLERLVAERSP